VPILILYILLIYEKSHIASEESGDEALAVVRGNTSGFWRGFSFAFFILLMLRVVFQAVVGPSKCLCSPKNYLEILLPIMSASILICEWVHHNTRPHFSAIAILLSWAD
jgi:hypothetical protein